MQRVAALLPEEETGSAAFANSSFTRRGALSYYEKVESVTPHAAAVLNALGGSAQPAGLWGQVAGMAAEKSFIERRVVLPLARRTSAATTG